MRVIRHSRNGHDASSYFQLPLFPEGAEYPSLFAKYDRQGQDWLRRVSEEDRKVFSKIGLRELRIKRPDFHRMGGKARASLGIRGYRGRFISLHKEKE